jgi:hypothetical protein
MGRPGHCAARRAGLSCPGRRLRGPEPPRAATPAPASGDIMTASSPPAGAHLPFRLPGAGLALPRALLARQGYAFEGPSPFWPLAARLTAEPGPLGRQRGLLLRVPSLCGTSRPCCRPCCWRRHPAPPSSTCGACPGSKDRAAGPACGPGGLRPGHRSRTARAWKPCAGRWSAPNALACGTCSFPGQAIPLEAVPGRLSCSTRLLRPGHMGKHPEARRWQGARRAPGAPGNAKTAGPRRRPAGSRRRAAVFHLAPQAPPRTRPRGTAWAMERLGLETRPPGLRRRASPSPPPPCPGLDGVLPVDGRRLGRPGLLPRPPAPAPGRRPEPRRPCPEPRRQWKHTPGRRRKGRRLRRSRGRFLRAASRRNSAASATRCSSSIAGFGLVPARPALAGLPLGRSTATGADRGDRFPAQPAPARLLARRSRLRRSTPFRGDAVARCWPGRPCPRRAPPFAVRVFSGSPLCPSGRQGLPRPVGRTLTAPLPAHGRVGPSFSGGGGPEGVHPRPFTTRWPPSTAGAVDIGRGLAWGWPDTRRGRDMVMLEAKNRLGIVFFPAFDWPSAPRIPSGRERLLYTRDQLLEEGLFRTSTAGERSTPPGGWPRWRTWSGSIFCLPDVAGVATPSRTRSRRAGPIKAARLGFGARGGEGLRPGAAPGHPRHEVPSTAAGASAT